MFSDQPINPSPLSASNVQERSSFRKKLMSLWNEFEGDAIQIADNVGTTDIKYQEPRVRAKREATWP
jgi:hypothetical protein